MPMLSKTYRVHCDHPGCLTPPVEHTTGEREVGGPGDARRAAHEAGWSRRSGVDACPQHLDDLVGRPDPVVNIHIDSNLAASGLIGARQAAAILAEHGIEVVR